MTRKKKTSAGDVKSELINVTLGYGVLMGGVKIKGGVIFSNLYGSTFGRLFVVEPRWDSNGRRTYFKEKMKTPWQKDSEKWRTRKILRALDDREI